MKPIAQKFGMDGRPRRHFLVEGTGIMTAFAALSWAGELAGAAGNNPRLSGRQRLEQMLPAMEAADDKMMLVPRSEGMFLYLVAKLRQARSVLEVGTAHGYWTLWLASAIQEFRGRITTLELMPERVRKAREHLKKSGWDQRIIFHEGNAHALVPTLKGTFDLVFLNADKSGLVDYFQKLVPKKINPGAVILAHEAIARRDDMKEYLDLLARHPDFDSVVACANPEDGFSFAIYKG